MRAVLTALAWMVGAGVAVSLLVLAGMGFFSWDRGEPRAPEEAQAPARVCPPPVAVAPRAPGAPVDDVAGVRRGYTLEEAQETLLCADERYAFRFEPVWHSPNRPEAPRQLFYAERPGGADVVAGLLGDRGGERVAMLWRRETYGAEGAPTLAALEAQLLEAYGPPHAVEQTRLRRILIWAYDPAGAPLAKAPKGFIETMFNRRPTVESCAAALRDTPFSAPAPDRACGVTVRATIEGRLEAADRASSLRLALADQAALAADFEAYRAARNTDR